MLDDIRNNYLAKITSWLPDEYKVSPILGVRIPRNAVLNTKPIAHPAIRITRKSNRILSWTILDLILLGDRIKLFRPDKTPGSRQTVVRIWSEETKPLSEIHLSHPQFDRVLRETLLDEVSKILARVNEELARTLVTRSQAASALV